MLILLMCDVIFLKYATLVWPEIMFQNNVMFYSANHEDPEEHFLHRLNCQITFDHSFMFSKYLMSIWCLCSLHRNLFMHSHYANMPMQYAVIF